MKLVVQKIINFSLSLFLFLGFILIGNSDVLCIGEDGYIEIETECLPCCQETDGVCKTETLNNVSESHAEHAEHAEHDNHADCSNCSGLSLEGPLWSVRYTRINLFQIQNFNSTLIIQQPQSVTLTSKLNLSRNFTLLTFKQNPPTVSLATTLLLC